MKKTIIIIAAVLSAAAVAVTVLALRPARVAPLPDITAQPTKEPTPKPTAEVTPIPEPEVTAPAAGEDEMSDSERTADIERFLNAAPNNGFLLSAYDDVRDVRLYEVLYQCSGEEVPYDSAAEAYRASGLELSTDLSYLSSAELDALLKRVAGYGLDETEWQLDDCDYLPDVDIYCIQHGDTNIQPVRCRLISSEDGTYEVLCRAPAEDTKLLCYVGDEARFVSGTIVTLRYEDGGYRFVSNELEE